jgi:predicted metal-dependent phosphotriesterase family hydrolase
MPTVQTVLGPIPAEKLGFTLPHEHVLCDFIGAEKTNRKRWKVDTVVTAMLPHLKALKERGVASFVDCTPAYIGRDPRVLRTLSEKTGLHLLTNTGYYGGAGDKFLPKHAFTETDEQLFRRWKREWEKGIDGIKPGFVKIGVDEVNAEGRLSEVDAKLIRAAARLTRETGLSVTCHTGGGPAGLAAARLFAESGAPASRFVVAHSDGHEREIQRQVAALGAWVSLDAVGWRKTEEHVPQVLDLLKTQANRLLLSMDSGWWWVGEPEGGKIRPYTYLTDDLLPALRAAGVTDATIRKLTIENPAQVFALGT